jgi:hypothetical protein
VEPLLSTSVPQRVAVGQMLFRTGGLSATPRSTDAIATVIHHDGFNTVQVMILLSQISSPDPPSPLTLSIVTSQ